MSSRWSILALLFAVRSTMAFQFQSVAALAPLIQREFAVGLADIGLAIGLYLAPGIVLAMPGGAIGRRLGDKTVVAAGLGLMLCGGLVMAMSGAWQLQLAGRLVAGTGGVLLNVLMSKMVTDWFAGREIATAMAIFVNSWPFGIAMALIALPVIAAAHGLAGAFLAAAALIAAGLVALVVCYRTPGAGPAATTASARPRGAALGAVIVAGLIWGLYNAAIGMVFGFGPSLLAERGWTLAAASSATSVVLWLVAASVPLGGLAADRSGRGELVLLAGCMAFAALLVLAARTEAVLPVFVALGLASGIAAGPILSLPVRVLLPDTRAVGMGIFFALFYLLVVLAPWLAGHAASAAGTAGVTFDLGAVMLVLCCAAVPAFRRLAANGP
jgi:MFS family permease